MVTTAKVRRAVLGAVLALGIALLAISVSGMVALDGQLSNAAERTAPALPVTDDKRDCPERDRERPARGIGAEA